MVGITTQVFQLPADDANRSKFLNGIKSLAEECNASWVSGSVHDEMGYADLLAEELAEHIGELGVEDVRQKFEREARM